MFSFYNNNNTPIKSEVVQQLVDIISDILKYISYLYALAVKKTTLL